MQSIALVLTPIRDELIQFIQQQLVQFQPRDDYRELLQLSLVFLGADYGADVHILHLEHFTGLGGWQS